MKKRNVIAIDGVAYSGKSTIASALARLTGYRYVNTGHMYRSVAKLALEAGISLKEVSKVTALARRMRVDFKNKAGELQTWINGKNWTRLLDRYEIVQGASQVATYPEVRKILTLRQRSLAGKEMMIMEGRDVGTIVFPQARWKFFVTASLEIRARRMVKLMTIAEKKNCPPLKTLMRRVHEIDERDRRRPVAPLRIAKDALLYDNSAVPSPEQDALILAYYLRQSAEILHNARILKKK